MRPLRGGQSLNESAHAVARAVGSLLPHELKRRLFRLRPAAVTWDMPDHGFAYVQVHKVATTSMRAALAAFAAGADEIDPAKTYDLEKAAVARYELNAFPAEIRRISRERFTFAFVRNPLDRLYSAWVNKVASPLDDSVNLFSRHGISLDASFPEFVERVARLSDARCDTHLRSQHLFISDKGGLVVDHLGRFETLERDWDQLRERFGFPSLPKRNVSQGGSYEDAYTPEVARLVADRYRHDIELFAYDADVARLTG